ncbi:MAG: sigma-70 family RNA polymerase sigma factor [Streptosporangiales bacterium]|nr:sigma-70 family RNA polymerase sigma factor [Streptosporangiales bacterium]
MTHAFTNRRVEVMQPAEEGQDPAGEIFERLFDEHSRQLYAYLVRRLGRDHAEDVVADTFEAVLRQWHRYDPDRGTARAWLFGIATNLARRHVRDEQRTLVATARLAADRDGGHTHEFGAVERADAQARVRQLAGALAELSPGDRDVLLLTAWAQLDTTEVAAALGIPAGTVRSRLHRVRRRVRVHAQAAVEEG